MIIRDILGILPESSFQRVEKRIAEELAEDHEIMGDRAMYDYVYDVGGFRDTVQDNGILVQDTSSMAKAMRKYARSRPSVATCHAWAKRFDWKKSERKWMGVMNA